MQEFLRLTLYVSLDIKNLEIVNEAQSYNEIFVFCEENKWASVALLQAFLNFFIILCNNKQ